MSFLIGIVIAQQGAVQLAQFGAEVYTINLIGRITVRELGVLMTAIMVAGRSGSAFAAQIGTMKITEEIDAMRTIGVSPIEALVLPRMMAAVLMMPLLAFWAMLTALLGGGMFVLARPRHPAADLHPAPPGSDSDDRPVDRADQGAGVRLHHRARRLLPGHAGRRATARRSARAPRPRSSSRSSW